MDLGAGTGIVTGHLIRRFRNVTAVEPDAGMAAKLIEQFPTIRIHQATAEECMQPPDTVDLITIANGLHWMDADRVFANVYSWLRVRAILAVFDRPLPKASPEIDRIIGSEFRGSWKPYRDARLKRDLRTPISSSTGGTSIALIRTRGLGSDWQRTL
jgi:SAM-dependent methyltransferase